MVVKPVSRAHVIPVAIPVAIPFSLTAGHPQGSSPTKLDTKQSMPSKDCRAERMRSKCGLYRRAVALVNNLWCASMHHELFVDCFLFDKIKRE